MTLTLAEPKYLTNSVSIISELVNEACFKVTPDAIELVAMDPANVAMVVFKLLSSSFTEYQVDKETEIAINLNNLKQILRRAKANDMLTLELDGENKLKIQFKGDRTRTFSLPIIELDEKEQKVPQLKFDVSVQAPSMVLNDAVEDADIVAESLVLEAVDQQINVVAEGDLSKVKVEIKDTPDVKIVASSGERVGAKYSIEYLKKMIDGSKLADTVSMHFSKDYPLKLEYTSIDKVSLSFILAPRVENE